MNRCHRTTASSLRHGYGPWVAIVWLACLPGCGTMKSQSATEQLLASDAVDRSIDQLDFAALAGSKVFLDTRYMTHVNSVGFVNASYITSSLREQMLSANCVLMDDMAAADFVVEVRVGALGTDGHEVNYGVPGSRALNTTAALVTNSPVLPVLPEISLARKDERRAAVKLGVFIYHRETREPAFAPAMVQGESKAKSTWVLGAGPFQKGSIYETPQFAGAPLEIPEPIEDLKEKVARTQVKWPKWLPGPRPAREAEMVARRPETPAAEAARAGDLPSLVTRVPSDWPAPQSIAPLDESALPPREFKFSDHAAPVLRR